jgi:putative phosphonate catabolism associated alcohol dehydrogenase
MASLGRAVVLAEAGKPLEFREYPVPDPEAGAALVRVTLSNVCGSDLHIWRGELDPAKRGWPLPRHQGHEMTGRIEKLGEGVTTDSDGKPLTVGDRVVFQYFFPCGRCRNCLNDYTRACPKRYAHTALSCDNWPHFNGAFGDYFYLRQNHTVFKVPDDLTDDLVVGVNCAFSQVVCGLDSAKLGMGETVVIQGAGGLGLYAIAVAKERGAGQVIVVDGVAERLDVAESFGADRVIDMRELPTPERRAERVRELTDGWGAEVVVDVAGFPQVVEEGMKMMAGGGRYVEIGNISPGLTYAADPSFWVTNNCSIFGVHVYEPRHLREALDLLDRGRQRYPFHKIVSHRFPLEEINDVMAAQAEGHITRASLVP